MEKVPGVVSNSLKGINKLSVNGNNLYYLIKDTKFNPQQIFKENKNIDSIIALTCINEEENLYKMEVYERDGSVSNYCGNGSLGVPAFLGVEEVNFQVGEDILKVEEEKEKVLGEFIIKDDLDKFKEQGIISSKEAYEILKSDFYTKIEKYLSFYKKNYINIYDLFGKQYGLYISNLLSYVDEKDFLDFVKNVSLEKLISSNDEPHLIVKIKKLKQENKFNIYQKLLSFLIRFSYYEGNKIFPNSINVMFIDENNKIYSAERGVLNGINYDQTGACGTGTSSTAYVLGEKEYETISGIKIKTKKEENKVSLIIDKKNIIKLEEKDKESEENISFYHKMVEEQLKYLLDYFQVSSLKELSNKIINDLDDNVLKKIKEDLGTFVFNSGWHENEFPIDSYKIAIYSLQKYIEKNFKISGFLSYLDNKGINNKQLNQYPNVSTGKNKPKVVKSILNILKTSDSFGEFKEEFSEIYKKVFLFENASKAEFKKLLESFNLEQKEINNIVELIKYSNNTKNITKGFYKFLLKVIKNNWSELKLYPQNREKIIFKAFQDYFLSIYTQEKFPTLSKDLLNGNIELLSKTDFIKKIKSSIQKIYSSPFLKDLFLMYLQSSIENRGGKPMQLGIKENNGLFVDYIDGEIKYFLGKKEIPQELFLKEIEIMESLNGSISLFLLFLTGQIHIGSERGFRDVFISFLEGIKEKYPNKLQAIENLEKFLYLSYISGDYIPEEEKPMKIPAGTDNSWTGNIFLSVLLGKAFSKEELETFLQNPIFGAKIEKNNFYNLLFESIKQQLYFLEDKLKEYLKNQLKDSLNNDKIDTTEISNNLEFLTKVLTDGLNAGNIKKLLQIIKRYEKYN